MKVKGDRWSERWSEGGVKVCNVQSVHVKVSVQVGVDWYVHKGYCGVHEGGRYTCHTT